MRSAALPYGSARTRRARTPWVDPLVGLLAAGAMLELVLLAGFALPLAIRSHPYVIVSPQSLAIVLGTGATGAARFGVAVAASFAAFGLALRLGRRAAGRAAYVTVLAATVVFSITLLPINPLGAHDVYHDVADARTLWVYHQDPSVVPPSAHGRDWFTPAVPSWRTTPSAYGPVWYGISGAGLAVSDKSLWNSVLAQKLVTAVFLLGLTGAAMLLAGRLLPRGAVAAGVLVGWNPLLQFETAGNAHNDVVMVFFALIALYAITRRWWLWAFPLLAFSIATKPVLAAVGPLLLVYMLSPGRAPGRQALGSLVLGGVVLSALYAPFFHGASTIAGLHREVDHVSSSPGAVVHAVLSVSTSLTSGQILRCMQIVVWPPCILAYGIGLRYVWTGRSARSLLQACFWTMFVLLTVLTWWFMPWYLFWLVPLAAALPDARALCVAAIFSCAAMLMYVPHFWLLHANLVLLEAATATTAFLPPLVTLLVSRPRRPGARPVSTAAQAEAGGLGWAREA